MKNGKFNVLLDAMHGSSGKGLMTTYLANKYDIRHVSSANYPNAGHTAIVDGVKFVAKAIPTSLVLNKARGKNINGYISPGSGFSKERLLQEWEETGKPELFIHERASVVTEAHAERERNGKESTKHIASTMQGTAAAITDKIQRRSDVILARDLDFSGTNIKVVKADDFRQMTHKVIDDGGYWLHEGSQGYALSIDHGNEYPFCTSRNCTTQAAMDYMAIPPGDVGDVYLNLRTFPIRVGNVVEDGVQKGYSGGWYADQEELSWADVAAFSGMPKEEAEVLALKEKTTVTKRIRRVATMSFIALKDAVRVNGATKLCLNFMQYVSWSDAGKRGGSEAFDSLTQRSKDFIKKIEDVSGVKVVLIGTGPSNDDIIDIE